MGKWRDLVEEALAGIFFVIGCVLVVYGVIVRYVFNQPIFWVDEISTYFLVWGILLGWSIAEKDGHHISVGILYDFISRKWQYRISIFEKISNILFSLFLSAASIVLWLHYLKNSQVSLNAQISLWIVYLIMPIATILLFLRFLEELVGLFRKNSKQTQANTLQKGGVHQ